MTGQQPTEPPFAAQVVRHMPEGRVLHLDGGQEYVVRFDCNRCEDYRWRAVNPGRNVKRALAALDRGDEKDAREHLADALADLAHFAQWEVDDVG